MRPRCSHLAPQQLPAELHGRLQHRAAMIPSMRNGVSTHRGKLGQNTAWGSPQFRGTEQAEGIYALILPACVRTRNFIPAVQS